MTTHKHEDKHEDKFAKQEKPEKAPAEAPDQPACDPALGDLTPEYVEWFRKNHPGEFKAKYKNRIPELTEKPEEAKE